MSKTPDYVLTTPFTYRCGGGWGDNKTLSSGSFVRPIEFTYVPKHVKEDSRWIDFNVNEDIFCYTKEGIVPIPKKYLREK